MNTDLKILRIYLFKELPKLLDRDNKCIYLNCEDIEQVYEKDIS